MSRSPFGSDSSLGGLAIANRIARFLSAKPTARVASRPMARPVAAREVRDARMAAIAETCEPRVMLSGHDDGHDHDGGIHITTMVEGADFGGYEVEIEDHPDHGDEHGSAGPIYETFAFGQLDGGDALSSRNTGPDFAVTGLQIQDGTGAFVSTLPVGEVVRALVQFDTVDIAAGTDLEFAFTIDGITVERTANFASGTGSWWAAWWIGYADPGTSNVSVALDPNNLIFETNESNNGGATTVTSEQPTDAPLLQSPFDETNFVIGTNNYHDVDLRDGSAADFAGGPFQYDGHFAWDMNSGGFDVMDRGVPIYAAADGTVVAAVDGNFDRRRDWDQNYPANFVIVDHGDGYETIYWHLARNSVGVEVGDTVEAGDYLGLKGSSGISTGPHLHFTLRRYGRPIETMYDTQTYWSPEPEYQPLADPRVMNSTVTNRVPVPQDWRQGFTRIDTMQFGTSDRVVFQFGFTHLNPGQNYNLRVYRPDGTLHIDRMSNVTQQLRTPRHFWWFGLGNFNNIAGEWRMDVDLNGETLTSETFNLTFSGAPAQLRMFDDTGEAVNQEQSTPFDFGTAPGTSRTFTIENRGHQPLDISGIRVPLGFSYGGPPSLSIAPGATDTITITYAAGFGGSVRGSVELLTNDPDTPRFWFDVEGNDPGGATSAPPRLEIGETAIPTNPGAPGGTGPAVLVAPAGLAATANPGIAALDIFIGGGAHTDDELFIWEDSRVTLDAAAMPNVFVDGVLVASFTDFGAPPFLTRDSPLEIQFNSNATLADINAVLQRVALRAGAATGTRVIDFGLQEQFGAATPRYQRLAAVVPTPQDQPDPDDQLGEAALVTLNSIRLEQIDVPADVDMYVFDAAAGDAIFARVAGSQVPLDFTVRVFDINGNELASNTAMNGDPAFTGVVIPADGIYYVGVSGAGNDLYDPIAGDLDLPGVTGAYELRIEYADNDDTIAEARIAGPIASGQTISQSIDYGADIDIYEVYAAAGQEVTIDVDSAGDFDGIIRLFDLFGTELDYNDDGPGPQPEGSPLDPGLVFTASQTGLLYIGISSLESDQYDPVFGTRAGIGTDTGAYDLTVTVADPSDPPVIDRVSSTVRYVENRNPNYFARSARVLDADTTDFGGAVLEIAVVDDTGTPSTRNEDRVGLRDGGGVISGTGIFGGGTGVVQIAVSGVGVFDIADAVYAGESMTLTFRAGVTAAQVTQVLRRAAYQNTSESPDLTPRHIEVFLTDPQGNRSAGGAGTEAALNIVSVADPTQIANLPGATFWVEGEGPVAIAPDVVVVDVDTVDFDGSRIDVYVRTPRDAGDVFLFDVNAVPTIAVSGTTPGSTVFINGVAKATLTRGAAANRMIIDVLAGATAADVADLIRSIQFDSSNDDPRGPKQVRIAVIGDGARGASLAQIEVTPTNDPPTIVNVDGRTVNATAGGSPVRLASGFTIADPDYNGGGGRLDVSVSGGVGVASLTIASDPAGRVSLAGSSVLYQGVIVGTINNHTTDGVSILFNSSASFAAVRAVGRLLQVQFGSAATPQAYDVVWEFDDEQGLPAVPAAIMTVDVQAAPPASLTRAPLHQSDDDDAARLLDMLVALDDDLL